MVKLADIEHFLIDGCATHHVNLKATENTCKVKSETRWRKVVYFALNRAR